MLLPPPSAPTAPPASLTSFNITSRSFHIQWERVPCKDTNGEITGYSVLLLLSVNGSIQSMDTVDADVLQTNFTGLVPDTNYSVQVAGVNSKGPGVYHNLTVITPQSQSVYKNITLCSCIFCQFVLECKPICPVLYYRSQVSLPYSSKINLCALKI